MYLKSQNQQTIKIELQGKFGKFTWLGENISVNGHIFHESKTLTSEILYRDFINALNRGQILNYLNKLNGFFSFILLYGDNLYLVCDKIRSRPLFYSRTAKSLLISDSTQWLEDHLEQTENNNLSIEEFLKTGYVTGTETLIKNILQVQASEIVVLTKNSMENFTYYNFAPRNPDINSYSHTYWFSKIDAAIKRAIDRLILVANGRQIVIPLSGGYDSRALAIYLKESGYNNLLAFTFGKKFNQEAVISERIAKALNIEWHFVEYNTKMWKTIKGRKWFEDYIKLINSLVSAPNIQVLPAIKWLVENDVVSESAVVVPGHAADFVAGSHIPQPAVAQDKLKNIDDVITITINSHYRYNRKCPISDSLLCKIRKETADIYSQLQGFDDEKKKLLAACEAWNYRERQSKFISNSNRYYDFLGLDWWMPFWDTEFVAPWEQIPLKLRTNETLWITIVDELMSSHTNNLHITESFRPKKNRKLTRKLRSMLNYFLDPNHLYSVVPFRIWLLDRLGLSKVDGTLFGYLANLTLKMVITNEKIKKH